MSDTQTTKAAETALVKQNTEDRPPTEREYAPSAFAATLLRAAGSDDPTTPPHHLARVLGRLTAPHQTGFLLQCQHRYGNAYVQRMISSRDNGHSPLEQQAYTQEEPTAREITAPDVATAYAEQAASLGGLQNQVVQAKPPAVSIVPMVQRQKAKDDEEDKRVQSKSPAPAAGGFDAGEEVEARLSQSKSGGSPLPEPVRTYMEPRFGVDFGHVRVHTGNDAIQMNRDVSAQAFTHGADIYYGAGSSPTNLIARQAAAAKLSPEQIVASIVTDIDKIQREQLRLSEQSVVTGKIAVYYATWLDCIRDVVEKEKKELAEVETSMVLNLLLGAFSVLAGPVAGKLVGVLGQRLAGIGEGVETLIRQKVIERTASLPAQEGTQEAVAAMILKVRGKLKEKWDELEKTAKAADISKLLPPPSGAAAATSLDGVIASMKEANRAASNKAIEGTKGMNVAELVQVGEILNNTTTEVIAGKLRKDIRTLIDVSKAQAKGSNKTFRINAWGKTGVAILEYRGVSIAASQKATYRFVSWLPPHVVEIQGGAEKFPLFDVDAHRGPNVGPFDGVFVGFLPPPTFAEPYMAMINEYGGPRPALVQDVGSETHFVRWVPPDEAEYEKSRGAAKIFGFGQVKGVKPLDYRPTVR